MRARIVIAVLILLACFTGWQIFSGTISNPRCILISPPSALGSGYFSNTVTGTSVAYAAFANVGRGIPTIDLVDMETDIAEARVIFRYGTTFSLVTTNTVVATNYVPIEQGEAEAFGDGNVAIIQRASGDCYLGFGLGHEDDYLVFTNTLPYALTTNDRIWYVTDSLELLITNSAHRLSGSPLFRVDTVGSIEIYGSSTARVSVAGFHVR